MPRPEPTDAYVRLIGHLANNLRHWRSQRHLSMRRLAERSGVGRDTISRLESGRFSDPSLGELLRLQDALDLPSIELLIGGPAAFPSGAYVRQGATMDKGLA